MNFVKIVSYVGKLCVLTFLLLGYITLFNLLHSLVFACVSYGCLHRSSYPDLVKPLPCTGFPAKGADGSVYKIVKCCNYGPKCNWNVSFENLPYLSSTEGWFLNTTRSGAYFSCYLFVLLLVSSFILAHSPRLTIYSQLLLCVLMQLINLPFPVKY